MPATCTHRVTTSITTRIASVTRPCHVATLTVKQSVAARTSQDSVRHWVQLHARLPPLRGRLPLVATQEGTHRQLVDMLPQVRQGPLETASAPGRVLVRHADHALCELLSDLGAAKVMALRASVALLRDALLVPA